MHGPPPPNVDPRSIPIVLPKSRGLVPKTYPLLLDAVEAGVGYGWRRAHKHTDAPDPAEIQSAIEQAVIDAIFERFDLFESDT